MFRTVVSAAAGAAIASFVVVRLSRPNNARDAGKLIERYNGALMTDPKVRRLLATVVQDPQSETQDNAASHTALTELVAREPELLQGPRRALIAYLNSVYFTALQTGGLPPHFWFEMHTRFEKLLTAAMVLEGANLRHMGGTPETSDIPQCLTGLRAMLDAQDYDRMRVEYEASAGALSSEWLDLYRA